MDAVAGSFQSKDGTPIGYVRMGKGPALVIVHGSLYTGDSWLPVASLLSDRFTCCLIDRRGRARSGDAPAYAIEREYEDVEGALGIFGEGVSLLGHSFGAVCALGAALRAPVARLVLYEPPLSVGGPVAGGDLRAYRDAIAAGDPDAALEIGYTRFAAIPEAQVRQMRTSSRASTEWAQARALAWTWAREAAEIDKLGPGLERYRAIQSPTLLLLGQKSAPRPLRDTTEALRMTLPHARLSELQGQGHLAHLRKPDLVADRVREFLTNPDATYSPR
jgi:pimeloyl-ACP methyl ester carboxylesterase